MNITRRRATLALSGAPLLLLSRKSAAQTPSLNKALIAQMSIALSAAYYETSRYGYAADYTYNSAQGLTRAVRENFSAGLAQHIAGLGITYHGNSGLTAQQVWAAADELGWTLPSPDILCVDMPAPNPVTINAVLQYPDALCNNLLFLSEGLDGMSTLTPVHGASLYRVPRHPSLRQAALGTPRRYRLTYVVDLSGATAAQKKAALGAVSGGVLVAAGKELIAASGMTALTAEASWTAIGIFSGGVGLIVVGAISAAYWGYQAAMELSGSSGSTDDGTDQTLLHVPPTPMLPR